MVRIRAHLVNSQIHDENKLETITLVVLLEEGGMKIRAGEYFGQSVESRLAYPFRYDVARSRLFFGEYSRDDAGSEETYETDLHHKEITVGEYFNVTKLREQEEHTYVLNNVVDMNALPA